MKKFQLIQGGASSKLGPIGNLRQVQPNESKTQLEARATGELLGRIVFLWSCIDGELSYAHHEKTLKLPTYKRKAYFASVNCQSPTLKNWALEIIELISKIETIQKGA